MGEVPDLVADDSSGAPVQDSGNGFGLLTKLGIAAGVLLMAWGAVPAETKEKLKQDLWEQPKQELKTIAIVGVAAGAVYLGVVYIPPLLATVAPAAPSTMAPALAGGGTTGGVAMQQAAVGTVRAGFIAGSAAVVMRKAADHVSYLKSDSSGQGDDGVPFEEGQTKHIFRNGEGHVADTPENRKMLSDTVKGDSLGKDKFGNEWFTKMRPDGTQSWVKVRNGKIDNGGVNRKPLTAKKSWETKEFNNEDTLRKTSLQRDVRISQRLL